MKRMRKNRARALMALSALMIFSAVALARPATAQTPTPAPAAPPAPGAMSRPVGTVKAVTGTAITLATDAGAEVTVQIQDATRIVRIAPGQKDLKSATPATLADIQVGDRLLVGGRLGDDAKTVMASTVVVMKHADVEQTQEQQRQDWQTHGIGGLVSAVDPTQGSVVIAQTVAGAKKTVTIQISSSTIIRRYALQSVKFEDAQPSTLEQIKPGDQVRARGTMGPDGTSFSAEEIVSGAFRNISGTISAIDPTAGTITVKDIATKKPVLVTVSSDSQVRKLPQFMAMRVAARLKGTSGGAGGSGSGGSGGGAQYGNSGAAPAPSGAAGPPMNGASGGPGGAGGGGADLQQMLTRLPAVTLADFQVGDAVMIVSTEGSASAGVTAITLLGGVEAILEASPNGGASQALLSPWTIGGPAGEDTGE